ncbi:QcrA and Rieske domain-containing protein [Agromyces marinus]|uniref:Cytochrome bc1 complex Rieske iron-sulfur subunit n=1 Tax=Agromyces marinus TaxID=1389020 RepID=A0ABN6YL00_9MICO|nr:Rieske (2Fe-2S) protein [Agromyces marinus]UIP58819.1 Cytochrome b6-f complex iron-sulfur subunit [Agromyces marinus]BDZ56238.1 iron-sulfur protein [Agromyces marinus]
MDDARELSRRTALALGGGGVAAGMLALSGCAPSTPDESDSQGPTGDGGDGAGSAVPSEAAGEEIAALADIPVGGSISAMIAGAPVLLAQPIAGEVVAFSAVCTHQQCTVAAAGASFECPCHGSTFDAATGEVTVGPALEPLPSVPVTVDGDRVLAG